MTTRTRRATEVVEQPEPPMSLRGQKPPPPAEALVPLHLKIPAPVKEYLGAVSDSTGWTMTDIVLNAVALDRELAERMQGNEARLRAFAARYGWTLEHDLPAVLSALALSGLDAEEKKGGKR